MNSRVLPTIAIFIAIAIFFVYVQPTWDTSIAQKKAAIELDTQALTAAEEYKTYQNKLASERAQIDTEKLSRLEKFLPDSVDNVGLILDLNALAARSGLSLTNIDVLSSDIEKQNTDAQAAGATGPVSPTGSVSLSLTAAGTFTALQTFLSRIEASARLLDVIDIVVKGSNTGVYTYQMTLRLYWLR